MAASFAEVVQTRGICFVCGCSQEEPCIGGCSWVDAQDTVCSRCMLALGSLVIEYLLNEVCGTRDEQQERSQRSRLVLP